MSDPQDHSPAADSVPGQETPGQKAPGQEAPGQEARASHTGGASGSGFADRSYRSTSGVVTGVLLIALTLWLCGDAIVNSHGHSRWYAVALLALLVPLFAAFTVLPVVRANEDRLIVRNPFRTVTAFWSEVESIQAALSVELRAGGKSYQIWAIPVSLRQRKRAGRRAVMASGDRGMLGSRRGRTGGGMDDRHPVGGPGLRSRGRASAPAASGYGPDAGSALPLAAADRTVAELRELAAQAEARPSAVGPASVVWAWWIIAPVVAGAVAVALIAALG
jgi:hypothetical protein